MIAPLSRTALQMEGLPRGCQLCGSSRWPHDNFRADPAAPVLLGNIVAEGDQPCRAAQGVQPQQLVLGAVGEHLQLAVV
jgi:hypothetical protein